MTRVRLAGVSPNCCVIATISCSGYKPGVKLRFLNGASPAPKVASITLVYANTLVATLTVKRGGPRRERIRDVKLTNSDGSTATLKAGFAVIK